MIWRPTSSRSRGVIAFTAPCVPTGMNTGVSTSPCAVTSAAARGAVVMGEREHEHRQEASIIPPVKKLRVGVIYGGRSGEHEVSVASAASIFKHLDRTRYEPVPIRIEKDGRWTLADQPPTAMSAAEVIEQARASTRAAAPARPRHGAVAHPERGHAADDRAPARGAATPTSSTRSSPGSASTSCSRCCTARTARTARCRACSSWPTCRTSAPACWPRPSAWTRR